MPQTVLDHSATSLLALNHRRIDVRETIQMSCRRVSRAKASNLHIDDYIVPGSCTHSNSEGDVTRSPAAVAERSGLPRGPNTMNP